jgi:tRNA 2-thiouridine synthesizing protein A
VIYLTKATCIVHFGGSELAEELKCDEVLDARNALCPVPVVRLMQAIKRLQPGQVVLLLATDPGSKTDIPAWEKQTGNRILAAEEEDGVYKFWIQKVA